MFRQLYDKAYYYNIYLCDFKKVPISQINFTNISYSPRFDSFSELDSIDENLQSIYKLPACNIVAIYKPSEPTPITNMLMGMQLELIEEIAPKQLELTMEDIAEKFNCDPKYITINF